MEEIGFLPIIALIAALFSLGFVIWTTRNRKRAEAALAEVREIARQMPTVNSDSSGGRDD